jgi:hypothetical protein
MSVGFPDVPVPPPVTTATRPSTSKMFDGCRCEVGRISVELGPSSKPVLLPEEGGEAEDMARKCAQAISIKGT